MRISTVTAIVVCLTIISAAGAYAFMMDNQTMPGKTTAMMPVMVPVLTNNQTMTQMMAGGSIIGMAPIDMDRQTLTRAMGKNVTVQMMPMRMMSGVDQATINSAMRGQNISPPTMDPTAVARAMANQDIVLTPVIPAMASLDPDMMSMLTANSAMYLDQTHADKMMAGKTPMMVTPMMIDRAMFGQMGGKGISIDKSMVDKMVGTGTMTVMVPMLMTKQMVNSMITDGRISMVMPALMPMMACKPTPTTP